jgi:hypothetical protein
MNIEQLNSYIDSKEALDQKAISQLMLLIEKYPYFQAAHMLLLKAMHLSQPEKYNGQLKISGSFISDKKKLYHYIHTGSASLDNLEKTKPGIETEIKKAEIISEIKPIIIEKDKKIIKEKNIDSEKVLEKEVPKKELVVEKEIVTEKETISAKDKTEKILKVEQIEESKQLEENIKKATETIVRKPEVRKKVDLPDDEIEKIANQNSEIKHKKIVSDFFNLTGKEKIEKKTIEPENKIETKKETKQETVEKIEFPKKEEIKTLLEEKKRNIIAKNEPVIVEKKIKTEQEPIEIAEETIVDQKKTDEKIVLKKEEEPVKEKELPVKKPAVETKVEVPVNKNIKDDEKTSDTMSNIFSKIRQIKKEMNIENVQKHETIDINPTNEISKIVRSKKTEEIKGGKKIKESFIGFEESDIKTEDLIGTPVKIEKESPDIEETTEKEVIKESGITAKDLFKQRLQSKEKNIESGQKVTEKTSETKSPISKIVENVNKSEITEIDKIKEEPVKQETVKIEPVKQETDSIKKETDKYEVQTPVISPEGESAADALLRRIAEKKKMMHDEKEKEELEKLQKKENPVTISAEKTDIKEIKTEQVELIQEEKKEVLVDKSETESPKEKKSQHLIDSFIEKVDSLDRLGSKETSIVGDISEKSTEEKDEFMTENMADLLIKQKNYQKAIEIYNKLILKFPEKKTYFAIQIKKTESLIK